MLEESLDKLRANLFDIIDTTDDAVFIKDLKGVYLYVNHTAAKLIGRSVAEITGRSDREIFPSESLDQIIELDQRVINTKRSVTIETHYVIKHQEHWFQTRISPAYSSDKNLIGIIGISRDITDHKHLQSKIEEYSEELEIILNNSNDAIYRKDLQGRYVFINQMCANLMQLPQEKIVGQTDSELFGDLTTKKIRKTDREVISKKKPQTITTKYSDEHGDRWFNVSVSPAYGGENNILGIVGISKDITKLKQLEMELRERNEQLLTILESSEDAIFSKDLSGKYIFINSAGENFLGRSAESIIGKTDKDLFDPETYESIHAFEKNILDKKQSLSTDECFGQKGKESWYHSTVSPAFSSVGELVGLIGISRNMTEYHKTQEQLWKSETRYHALYNDTPAMFLTLDEHGQVVEANAYGASKLGYTVEELKNTSIYNIIPSEDKGLFRRNLQKALDNPGTLYTVERRYKARDGTIIWGKDFIRVVFDQDGNPNIPVLSEDVTEARELSDELDYRQTHDQLTPLLNRIGFINEVERSIQIAHEKNICHVLYMLELDDFKIVNDTCGHHAGDELLKEISRVIKDAVRERDIVARLGGDEFAVLMENCDLTEAEHIIENVLDVIRKYKFINNDKLFNITPSIGVISIDNETTDTAVVMTMADHAVFSAKDLGKNRIYIYDETDISIRERRAELETLSGLTTSLELDHFQLFAQKIVPVISPGQTPSYEILVRMEKEGQELVQPGKFLPAFEHYHMVSKLDRWVIDNTFKWLSNQPILDKANHFSINLSGQSLTSEYILDFICNCFIDYKIPYEKICFEITETAAIATLKEAIEFINVLKNYGCKFALDDFGAGLSSFRYLKDIPVNYVKIDGAFIKNITNNQEDYTLTEGMHNLVSGMGIETIAEFVETEYIFHAVSDIGIDYAQGLYVGPAHAINDLRVGN